MQTTFPVFDLDKFESSGTEEKRALGAEVDRICRDTGFLAVTNHGIPQAVIDAAWSKARAFFDLPPEQAFGPRNPELIQRVSRATLRQNSQLGEEYRIGDLVEFAAPGGGQFAGVLREIDEQGALFDFNHPLAGQSLKFEVKIIGIL